MTTLTLNQLVSVSDLQKNYAGLIEKVKKLAKPIFLLRRNEPEAVLISVSHYEDLIEKRKLYEENLALSAIEEFEKEKKAGTLFVSTNADDLFKFEKEV